MSALLLLFRMKSIASFRSWWRQAKTPSGAIRALFTFGFLLLLMLPLLLTYLELRKEKEAIPVEYVEKARYAFNNLLPLTIALLSYVTFVLPRNSGSLNFRPSEIDFLFPAPFTRRELLVYKLFGVLTATMAICFFGNCFVGGAYAMLGGSWILYFIRCYIAFTMAALMFQLFFIWSGLLRKSFMLRMFTPLRRIVALVGGVLGLVGLIAIRKKFSVDMVYDAQQALPVAKAYLDSTAIQWFITPFRIFSNVILSDSFGGAVFWVAICGGVNAFFVFLIMKTDENFLETELLVSQLRMEEAKKMASLETAMVSGRKSGSLPMLPFWGGIGPIAWRQLQTFYRAKRELLFVLALYLVFMVFMLLVEPRDNPEYSRFGIVIASLQMLTLGGAISMPMGFQTDIKKMDIFKSLPMSSWQIAAGQLAGPLLMLVSVQWLIIFIFMFTAIGLLGYWLAAAAFAPVNSLLVLCVLNSLSLIYPKRPDNGIVREMENIGHLLVFVFLMSVIATVLAATLAGVGYAVYSVTGSIACILVACWLVMLWAGLLGVFITTKTFERFDVSKLEV